MTEKIVKKLVTRQILSESWGQRADLVMEDNFSIQEYTVNSKDKIQINLDNEDVHFILVAGCAEFSFNDEKKMLFKGDKTDFATKNKKLNITITNCGVIPLTFVKIRIR